MANRNIQYVFVGGNPFNLQLGIAPVLNFPFEISLFPKKKVHISFLKTLSQFAIKGKVWPLDIMDSKCVPGRKTALYDIIQHCMIHEEDKGVTLTKEEVEKLKEMLCRNIAPRLLLYKLNLGICFQLVLLKCGWIAILIIVF